MTIFLILIFTQISFSQELIVGELTGKVDHNDIEKLLRTNYYPAFRTDTNRSYRLIKNSPNEVIFRYINPHPLQPQKVIFRFFNSEMTMAASIITDEIDFAKTESAKMAREVHKSNPSIRVLFQRKPNNVVKMIAYNNRHPILKNSNARKALSYAINKNYILSRLLLKNQADITSGPLNRKVSELYDSGFKEYKYNLKKAIEILTEQGWHDLNQDGILEKNNQAFRFTLIYEKGVLLDENMIRIIKIDWNKIGIDVSIQPLIKKEIKQKLKSNNFDAILTEYQFGESIESFENSFSSTGKNNFLQYTNRKVDRFLNLAKQAPPPTRVHLLKSILNTIIQEQPASFLFFLWLDWNFVNAVKFDNFLDENNKLRPFCEWKFKQQE